MICYIFGRQSLHSLVNFVSLTTNGISMSDKYIRAQSQINFLIFFFSTTVDVRNRLLIMFSWLIHSYTCGTLFRSSCFILCDLTWPIIGIFSPCGISWFLLVPLGYPVVQIQNVYICFWIFMVILFNEIMFSKLSKLSNSYCDQNCPVF